MALNMLRMTSKRFITTSAWRATAPVLYADRLDYPAPLRPFIADEDLTSTMQALKTKEQGDWKHLTIDDKTELYRMSFDKSYSEMRAPSGEWKYITGAVFGIIGIAIFFFGLQRIYVNPDIPRTMTKEWQQATMKYSIDIRNNPVTGLASKWDYDKNDWKK